ncbi:extracellular solute-binding protein [Ferroacidibacillus organovorans]|nr:extracellular solute-binding protein [Ferroacidibacillus organovorans]
MSIHVGSRMKKAFVASASIALLASVASGDPSYAKEKHAPSSPVVHIVFWFGHSSGQLLLADKAEVKRFNETHPGIQVDAQVVHASSKGVAAFLAGKAPNVAMIATDAAQNFINAGALLNLKPFLSSKSGLTPAQIKNDYFPAVWKDMQSANGKQYIMPLEKKSAVVLYYNADLFKQAHLSGAPHTWAQVVADATKITKLNRRDHGIEWTPSVRQFFTMTMDFGGTVWSDPAHKHFNLVNPGAEKALSMLRDMVAKKILIPTQGYNYQLDFGTGKVGMLIDASAGYTYDLSSVGGKFPMLAAPAPFGPSGRNYNYINGASLAMFNDGTKAQQQASFEFVKFMSSPQNNTYWNEHTNYLPLGPASLSQMREFYAKKPAWAASYSNPKFWVIKPPYATYSAAKSAMMNDFMKGLLGQESIIVALKNMTASGNQYMNGQQRL